LPDNTGPAAKSSQSWGSKHNSSFFDWDLERRRVMQSLAKPISMSMVAWVWSTMKESL